jgi:hypothetical protein
MEPMSMLVIYNMKHPIHSAVIDESDKIVHYLIGINKGMAVIQTTESSFLLIF